MVRHRNWILAAVLIIAVIAGAALGSRSSTSGGSGVAGSQVHFGTRVAAPAGSSSALRFSNGWIAKAGHEAIAVYAASAPASPQNGVFLVQRRSGGESAPWRTRTILVRGSGTLTLLRPPTPASESAALQTTLHFVTANGGTGTLDLSDDRVTVSR